MLVAWLLYMMLQSLIGACCTGCSGSPRSARCTWASTLWCWGKARLASFECTS